MFLTVPTSLYSLRLNRGCRGNWEKLLQFLPLQLASHNPNFR
jgi:hypothetical protein